METLKNLTELEIILALLVVALFTYTLMTKNRRQSWNNYRKHKPPLGVEVLAYHENWEHEDFNPMGVRIGFYNNEEEGFISAMWNNNQDCYDTIDESVKDNEYYSYRTQWSKEPQKWIKLDSLTGSLKGYAEIKIFP